MRRLVLMALIWGTIPAFFVDPFYGIVHYTLINIIRPEQLLWGRMGTVGRIYLASQAACFAAWFVNRKNLSPENTPIPFQIILLVALALAMVIVTYVFAFDRDVSWRWTDKLIKTIIFCFVMSKSINTAKKLERYYAVSLLWLIFLALWGILQKLSGNERIEGLGGAQMPDSNAIAALYVLYLPMAYYSILSRKKWIKLWIGIPSFVIIAIFILFTGSRGAFLGLVICVLWIFVRTKGVQKFKMLFVTVIAGGLLLAILSLIAPEGFFDEYTDRLGTMIGQESIETGEVEYESSASARLIIWKVALNIYSNHPEYWFWGVGMGCFSLIYKEYIDEWAPILNEEELGIALAGSGGSGVWDMHNSYLNVLLGGGAVTFFLWMFLILYCWLQARNIPMKYPKVIDGVDIHNYALAIEAGLLGWGVTMLFGTRETIDFFYWMLTMPGIIANLGKAELERGDSYLDDEVLEEVSIKNPGYASYF